MRQKRTHADGETVGWASNRYLKHRRASARGIPVNRVLLPCGYRVSSKARHTIDTRWLAALFVPLTTARRAPRKPTPSSCPCPRCPRLPFLQPLAVGPSQQHEPVNEENPPKHTIANVLSNARSLPQLWWNEAPHERHGQAAEKTNTMLFLFSAGGVVRVACCERSDGLSVRATRWWTGSNAPDSSERNRDLQGHTALVFLSLFHRVTFSCVKRRLLVDLIKCMRLSIDPEPKSMQQQSKLAFP